MDKKGLKFLGKIDVDSGLVQVGDPCYESWANKIWDRFKLWYNFLDKLSDQEVTILNHGKDNPGRGIVVHTAYGDGSYSVYGKLNKSGKVVSLVIDLEG